MLQGVLRLLRPPPAPVLASQDDRLLELLGRAEIQRMLAGPSRPYLRDYEVRVFSQWGEDGILAYLLSVVEGPRSFLEIGVEDYRECNTRMLIRQGDWWGVIVEMDPGYAQAIRGLEESWKYDLRLVEARVTAENVNDLVTGAGMGGEIGLLSVDIDGNDFWVWQALTVVEPAICVIEFNSRFGSDRAVTVPYDPDFDRMVASPSGLYAGASLSALVKLGRVKGYDYVGSNRADNNAFFVRTDLRPDTLPALTAAEGWRRSRFREMRDAEGNLTFATPVQEDAVLVSLPLVDV